MTAPPRPDFSKYSPPEQRQPTPKARQISAGAAVEEAQVPYAASLAASEAQEAQARAAEAQVKAADAQREATLEEVTAQTPEEARRQKGFDKRTEALRLEGYLGNIQEVRDLLSSGTATGPVGQLLQNVWGTKSASLTTALEQLQAPLVLEAMEEARKGSAVGATGFGQLSIRELNLLKNRLFKLSQSQEPEILLKELDKLERHYRRFISYISGIDPDETEGAVWAGLSVPEGEEVPPPDSNVEAGEWQEDPELKGVDAAIVSMIKKGRSADQIRAWLDSYQEGLGARVGNLEGNIKYYRDTGEEPRITVGRNFVPSDTFLGNIADSGLGAAFVAASDQVGMGMIDEFTELMGGDRDAAAAVMRGLRKKYPKSSAAGDVAGAVTSTVSGTALATKAGLKMPKVLEGVVQETLYGAGSSEPGQRGEGATLGALLAPVSNVAGGMIGGTVGRALRGAETPEVAALMDKYKIPLTRGQATGDDAFEQRLADVPILGGQIRERRAESVLGFNRAAFDEALAPLGKSTEDIGQRGIAEAQDLLNNAYFDALSGVQLRVDNQFAQTLRGKPYAELRSLRDGGDEIAEEVDAIFRRYSDPSGAIYGESLQQALIDLRTLKNAYKQDPRWATKIAPQIDEISDAYSGLLERQAPDNFALFQDANEAYRNVSILERAVDYAGDVDVFGPGNLRVATRQATNKFGGKKASARGDRPFNELVMGSLSRIPEKQEAVPLVSRFAIPTAGGLSFGAGSFLLAGQESGPGGGDGTGGVPAAIPLGLLAAGLGSVPYSQAGVRLGTASLRGPRTPQQRALGDLLMRYSPAIARGATRATGLTTEDTPMPQDFDYSEIGSPEFREAVTRASENAVPLTAEERVDSLGFDPQYRDIDPETGEIIERNYAMGGLVRKYGEGGEVTAGDRLRQVGKGALFGFGDEAEAAVRSVLAGDLLMRNYPTRAAKIRDEMRRYEEAHPYEALAYEAGGMLVPAVIPGGQGASATRLAALAARNPRLTQAGLAVGQGALYGAGTADSVADIPRSMAEEGVLGGVGYGVMNVAGKGLKKAIRRRRAKKGR